MMLLRREALKRARADLAQLNRREADAHKGLDAKVRAVVDKP